MRSKMLGIAIALSTFGAGVTATTLWIGHHNPAVQKLEWRRADLEGGSRLSEIPSSETAPCRTTNSEVVAGSTSRYVRVPISGGALNGKAVSKPQPIYPADARAALVSGEVVVEVTVDECGNVVMARALSGHPLLRQAAIDAAIRTRFSPTLLSGLPVRVKGTMAYNFSLQ
jgi:TonB family protein